MVQLRYGKGGIWPLICLIQQIQNTVKMEKFAIIGNLDDVFIKQMAILNHIIHVGNSSVAKWNSFSPNFLNSDKFW